LNTGAWNIPTESNRLGAQAPIPVTGPVLFGCGVHGETNSPALLETTYSAIGPKYQSEVALMHREQQPVVQTIKNPGSLQGHRIIKCVATSHHA